MSNLAGKPRRITIAWVLAVLLTVVAVVRIVCTYGVFNQTSDEPNHVAAGMELLDRGICTYEVKHPPLTRVASALGPYLIGRHAHGEHGLHRCFTQEPALG